MVSAGEKLSQHQRWKGLDGLRAIAIALVVIQHASLADYLPPLYWFPFCGRLGVSIFFVLSGFLITRILLREHSLKRFYARRALRIFPAFYAYLLALKLLPLLGFAQTDPGHWWASALYFSNWTPNYHDHNLRPTWSLAFEEQFYLIWPLAIWFFKTRARWLSLAIVLAWPILRVVKRGSPLAFTAGETLQSTGFETLMMGCLLALWWERGCQRIYCSPFGLFLALWTLFVLEPYWPQCSALLLPILRDCLIALLLASLLNRPQGRWVAWLETAPLVWLGTLSYSLYLWHPLFLKDQTDVVPHGPLCFLAIAVASALSYYLLERPLLKWRDRLRATSPSNDP